MLPINRLSFAPHNVTYTVCLFIPYPILTVVTYTLTYTYLDPASKLLKGEIPWEGGIEIRQKGKKHFQVHVPKRIYYLGKIVLVYWLVQATLCK